MSFINDRLSVNVTGFRLLLSPESKKVTGANEVGEGATWISENVSGRGRS